MADKPAHTLAFNYGLGMDDREIVAAIVADDLAGLAAAYDEHAESLYGYCRWMLSGLHGQALALAFGLEAEEPVEFGPGR